MSARAGARSGTVRSRVEVERARPRSTAPFEIGSAARPTLRTGESRLTSARRSPPAAGVRAGHRANGRSAHRRRSCARRGASLGRTRRARGAPRGQRNAVHRSRAATRPGVPLEPRGRARASADRAGDGGDRRGRPAGRRADCALIGAAGGRTGKCMRLPGRAARMESSSVCPVSRALRCWRVRALHPPILSHAGSARGSALSPMDRRLEARPDKT